MKKIFKKVITKLLLKKLPTHVESEGKFEVIRVNTNSEKFHEVLGISELRAKDLHYIIQRAIDDTKDEVEAIEVISKKCLHQNELYFSGAILRSMLESRNNPMSSLFSKLFK